jgi:hypothetical protein
MRWCSTDSKLETIMHIKVLVPTEIRNLSREVVEIQPGTYHLVEEEIRLSPVKTVTWLFIAGTENGAVKGYWQDLIAAGSAELL